MMSDDKNDKIISDNALLLWFGITDDTYIVYNQLNFWFISIQPRQAISLSLFKVPETAFSQVQR